MKKLQIVFIALLFVLLALPLAFFNWEENVVSEIDNRQLTNNPFGPNAEPGADLTASLESYVQDRIGFRDEMILGYTLLNDQLFHKMIHPLYEYGKDGYVFFKQKQNVQFGDYHIAFAEMLAEIQDYCQARDVPFLFVLNPEKTAVYPDKLRDGIHYDRSWVQQFEQKLDELGVNYIDNTQLLQDRRAGGEQVFNKVYNAGHWNDLGAFYGVNNILESLSGFFPSIQPNELSDFAVTETLQETLLSSQFPIHEYEPTFGRLCAGAPKTLVFQGSYMNEMGFKFLQTGLGEYIYVHDYENLMDFDYYFNIFQPECVVVEVAEYTVNSGYFNAERVENFSLNSVLTLDYAARQADREDLSPQIVEGERLSTLTVSLPEGTRYAYLLSEGRTFDLIEGRAGLAGIGGEGEPLR